ncbi:FxDxF family PEP-CTERM protein [Rhizobacter sp. Root1221]|uniref:FxDxF family PEP-CTERM protein n=1 Tax=Rhizobacter sp. Root1221 TaxID=1736433 RepID=UPI0009EBE787|nr:FxDxF family PEP-CTERM protein [Rhizobacter sp. Root1221]
MKLKMLAVAVALAAAGASQAATFNLGTLSTEQTKVFGNTFGWGQTFTDVFNFTLADNGRSYGGTLAYDLTDWGGISLTSLSLSGGSLSSAVTDSSPETFSFSNLLAGTYSLTVSGQATGLGLVGYLGTVRAEAVAAPVPEPETLAMMALGLGVMGFVARRRKQSAK